MRVNYLLILGCVGMSLWAWQQDPKLIDDYFVVSGNNLLQGRVWTLVTALFLHASPTHLLGNMLFLFVFGNTLEKMIGRDYFLAVFFIGGFTAFLLPPALGLYTLDTGMLGASAAIFTLTACVMLMNPLKFSFLFMAPQGLVAMLYFLYNVALVYDPTLIPGLGYDPSIAYVAHIIGFTVGVPFGIAWSKSWPRNLLISLGLFAIYLAILAILATFFGLRLPFGVL
ncbi:rhomboid family intramembrane serine protease [Candidatus Bathyarchaeota archaeon]|nr:MAG: rhomboid family intramembrane serine protease [Candidatus Bathyarchaeota archaeon]